MRSVENYWINLQMALPDERRGTSSLTRPQKRQLSPSQQTYRAAVTRNDFLKTRSGLDSGSAIGRR